MCVFLFCFFSVPASQRRFALSTSCFSTSHPHRSRPEPVRLCVFMHMSLSSCRTLFLSFVTHLSVLDYRYTVTRGPSYFKSHLLFGYFWGRFFHPQNFFGFVVSGITDHFLVFFRVHFFVVDCSVKMFYHVLLPFFCAVYFAMFADCHRTEVVLCMCLDSVPIVHTILHVCTAASKTGGFYVISTFRSKALFQKKQPQDTFLSCNSTKTFSGTLSQSCFVFQVKLFFKKMMCVQKRHILLLFYVIYVV